jgi:hypothetical protein
MGKFTIQPYGRLQEWIAHEKGYFRDEGLDYEFARDPSPDTKKNVGAPFPLILVIGNQTPVAPCGGPRSAQPYVHLGPRTSRTVPCPRRSPCFPAARPTERIKASVAQRRAPWGAIG